MSNLNSPVNQEAAKTTSETNASFLRAARAGNLDKVLEYLKENIDINTSNSNGLNALHLASKEGHVHVVDELLKQKADVNAATKKGNTALHIASLAGQQPVVELLVKSGANVDCRSQNGFTPLYMAAQENHLEVVRFLLANSANQSLATEDGFTPLAVALQQGHEKVVALLLENDSRGKIRLPALHIAAKKNDVKAAALLLSNDPNMDLSPEAGKSGFTPLHIAAHYGNVEIAKYLISKGANVNYEARQNITPLHVATKWGKGNSVNLLLENGAKIEAKTRDGLTPLHCAARSGHEEVVELLIAKQAPINAKTKNGLTALHMAAQGDHVEAARILLYHSPKLVDQTTCDFLTALHVAAHCGHVKIAKLLIDHKADVNSRALNGFTPLHIACKKNRIKVIELLIKHGASKEATTESGLTPLHVASFMGCMNVVVFLIQHGSLPNVPTIRGETPLHLAARANQTDIVRILLRHGASVDAKAKEQQTPLHIATRLGNTDIIALLLRHGAFVDAPTSDGYTPLHIASKEGQEEVASILFENGASLNVTTKKGFTPLHIAAKYGNIKVASLLLQRDAQPDIQGKNGLTPLHVATHYNRPSLAHLLLQHNASPHIVAKNGYSALHIAAKKNQLDIATTLLEYNAHTNCESNAGFTPLHLACQEGHLDMASLLLDHKAEPGASSKNGLTPLHLCAQEDKVNCAAVLVKMNAAIDPQTKAGYTPLHVACHFGQINMVKFLLGHMADVNIITKKHGFTALHCAAQQGHVLIVKLLLEHGASPDITNNNGQTPLAIAQRLGYISVIEELRQVTQTTLVSTTIKTTEEKYKVQTPETMQETFMSDSEDEMGDEAMFGDAEHYKYLTNEADLNNAADDSIALTPKTPKRDDSTKLPSPQTPTLNADLDLVTNQDENHINEHELRPESPNIQPAKLQPEKFIANSLGNMSMAESMDGSFYNGYASSKHVNLLNETDNIPIESKPKSTGFLISFMVDARGGAMKGCRHSGVRVIIPPKRASMPTRITCRFVRKEKLSVAPPLNESESLAARVLEMGPQGCKFLGPVVLEIPHYASLRGREREIVILRSDAGEKWHEHPIVASECAVEEALGCTLELLAAQNHEPDTISHQPAHDDSLSQASSSSRLRITRIITHDFPKYFALVSRVRHETHAVSETGGVISSTIVPKAQAVFPEKALQKKIKLSLQAMPIAHELVCKLFGNRVVVSPIVTIEPRRRKFHKAITLTIPLPKSPFKGMLNSYSHTNDSYSLRLLCSITGGLAPAQWEDITGHTPLSYIDECVSFTTTVSARFWLMDCQNVAEATKMATELYREAIAVPFMARFVVYAKRHDHNEAKLRVYCITDDKEEKTLEQREAFVVVAKSKEVEVLDNRVQWLEMSGNIAPVSLNKSSVNCGLSGSSDQLNMNFMAFYENRLPFTVRIKDAEQSAVNGRLVFLKDSRTILSKLDSATRSQPVCTLDVYLPSYDREQIEHDESKKRATLERGQLNLRTILNDSSATLLSQASSTRHNGHVTGFNLRLLANDLSNLVDAFDWVNLAKLLELTEHDIDQIKKLSSNSPNLLSASLANQTYDMLVYFVHKYNDQQQDEQSASYGHVLSKALQEMGVEADLVERNSYTLSGLLPQSTENIFSVEKSLNNKLSEHGLQGDDQSQLESSISRLKEAVDLYNNHEDRDIMKESESAQNSDNENEHDLVDNLHKENQIELSSLINQIDKQMDELERDNEHGDDLVSTVIIGEEHMDKRENGYVAKTIVDTVIQGISAKQFDNFNQHIEEVTQVTSLVEDKQETSDNEDLIQESVINQQNQLEEVEQAIHRDEDYFDDDDDIYDDNYDHDPETGSDRKNLNDDNNADCEEIFVKLDRSQLREFEFNSYDYDSNENSKFQNIEQQSPIIEQELMTTGQELENLKQRLVMSESVSEVTQNVLDSIRKEYSIEEKSNAEEIDPSQSIDPMVQQVIENLAKESGSEMEKIIMVEPFDNEVVYDSDSDEIDEFVKNENDDDGKDCLLESSSSEMSSLRNKIQAEHCENQDTELDQDSAWYHHTDQNESENLIEKLSQTKQYQTFESSSSSSLNDDTNQKEKSATNVQVEGAEEKNDNSVSIVIHGSTSSTADENDIKLDRSNLTIDLIKVSESREQLIENDHLQRVESSYDICSYANEQLVVGQSTDDISAATTIIEQQRFTPSCEAYCISSEAEVTDDENKIELKNSHVFLDIPIQQVINQSESSEPLILDQQVDQELISNSSASVNSINSSINSSSHYSLTTSDENMAKNLLDNENNDLSKSSSSSINFDDLNRKNISKSLNFLESLVVPSNVDPNEQIEEYTILLERQNELNNAHLIEHEEIKNIKSDLSPMKTSLSLNFNTKCNRQVKIERPKEIDFISSNFLNDYYNKECFDHQTPTPVENTAGSFFDKRITSSNEPSIDTFDKTSSADNSEKVDLNLDDCAVDNLINQLSDPEHAEEEVAAAFATAYLFSSNVNSQSNEELKSQLDIASEEEAFGSNRFFGIDNEAYASSRSSRESVIINNEYDDTDDQQQMKIKIIQTKNPSKSIICSSFDPQNFDESNESFENGINESKELNQDITDDIIIYQDELEKASKRTPKIELDNNDDENMLTYESSIEFDDLIEKVSDVSENYYNQDKEPLLTEDCLENFENVQEEQIIFLHPNKDAEIEQEVMNDSIFNSSSQIEELTFNIVTEEGVELDDQSFLISTPTNEIQTIQNDELEIINYTEMAKDLVVKTINDSIEKVIIERLSQNKETDYIAFNETNQAQINVNDKLEDSENNEEKDINSFRHLINSIDEVKQLNTNALEQCDSEKKITIPTENRSESDYKPNLGETSYFLNTPLVVLEHVTSEPNSDQEFDPEILIENSISHEICFENIENNNQELAKQIVDSIITKSIEKLNEFSDDHEKTDIINSSIMKVKFVNNSDNSNQLNSKEVRFNTNITSSFQNISIDCFDSELLNLQQIILNSNYENTFNQINKLKSQNSDSDCSPNELEKIIEDKFEDDQIIELDHSDRLIYIEAKTICDFVIDKAIKSLVGNSVENKDVNERLSDLYNEEEEKQAEKEFEKSQITSSYCFLENELLKLDSNYDPEEIDKLDAKMINATNDSELINSQSLDAFEECQLLENMKKPLLTSSFISDTLPSDSEADPASYHTALSGFNESKHIFSSSNYLTAHDDQDSNSQHQISASDSFYSANSKLKSLNSSNFSSFSNANNSYNNLDESYSTLNDTNNCSDFEHTIISESNEESKYEDVQSFIKDMQPLIETNVVINISDNENKIEQAGNHSPNQDSVTSSSSSVASVDIKSLSANTISTNMTNTSSQSSSLEINKQLEQGDNESCTSSILEFEKIEEQCMENSEDSSRIDPKNEIKDDTYSFFDSTVILSNDLNTIYETNEKESSSATSSPLCKSEIKLDVNQLETTLIKCNEQNDAPQIDLCIDLNKSSKKAKSQSASATTSPIQSPTCYRPKNIGSTSSLTKQVLQIQQLSTSRSSSSSSIKSTDSFENELKTKVKIDDNSFFAKIRQNTPPLIETKNESSELLDTTYNSRKKASKRTSRTSSSTSSTSSTSFHGENICNKLSTLNTSMGPEANVLTSSSSNLKQSVLTAEDLPSFKKSALSSEHNSAKVTSSVSSSNISSDPSKSPSLNQNLSQSANLEKKDEIHRSSSSHSHHSSDCYCGKSSPSLITTTNMSNTNNPTSSSSCFSFTTQGNDPQSNTDEKQLNVNVPSDSTSS